MSGDINGTVQGLNSFPQDTWPPVQITFQAYHVMIALGGVFIGIGLLAGLSYVWGRRLWHNRFVLGLLVSSVFLTELATIMGWWTAEIGRQPWIVWNLLRTADAVSPVLTTGQVFISLMMFVVLYIILFVLFLFLLDHKIKEGPEPPHANPDPTDLPDTFREIFRQPRASAAGEVD